MSKIKTPDWVLQGGKKPEKKIEKVFKIRKCPECDSKNVGVVIGENGKWECRNCKWKGWNINEEKLTEEQFMKHLDEKGEEVS